MDPTHGFSGRLLMNTAVLNTRIYGKDHLNRLTRDGTIRTASSSANGLIDDEYQNTDENSQTESWRVTPNGPEWAALGNTALPAYPSLPHLKEKKIIKIKCPN